MSWRPSVSLLLLAALGLSAGGVPARAGDGLLPRERVEPSRTGVVLLPPVDTESWSKDVLLQRQFVVRRRIEREFLERQFKVYGENLALPAAGRAPRIDLSDPAARTASNLDALARRLGADWMVSLDVQEVKDDPGGAMGEFRCHCRIGLKIWDADRHGWIADGQFVGRDQGGASMPVFLFMEAIDTAARGAVLGVIGGYPEIVPVADLAQVGDYLAGQTRPFVGDPRRRFAGFPAR